MYMTSKKSLAGELRTGTDGNEKLSAGDSPVNGTDVTGGLNINVNRSVTDQVRRVGRSAWGDGPDRVPPISDAKECTPFSGKIRGDTATHAREHELRKYETDNRKYFASRSSPVSRSGRNDASQKLGGRHPDETRRVPTAAVITHSPGSRPPQSNVELPSPHRRIEGKDSVTEYLSNRPVRDDMGGVAGGHDIVNLVKPDFDRTSAYSGVHSDYTTSLLLGLTGYPGGLAPTIPLPPVTSAERGNALAMLGNTFLPHLVLQQQQQQQAAAAVRLQQIQQQQLRLLHQSSSASSGSPLLSPFALHQSAADSRVTCQLEQLWQRKYPSHSVPPAWMLYQYQDELLRDPVVPIGADSLNHLHISERSAIVSAQSERDNERDKMGIREHASRDEQLSRQMEQREREQREWEREKERRERETNAEKEHFKREYFYGREMQQRERDKLDQEQKLAVERGQIRAATAAAVDRERRAVWEQRQVELDYRRQQQQHADQLLQLRRDRETILHLESPASTSVDAVNQHFQESFLRLGLPPTQKEVTPTAAIEVAMPSYTFTAPAGSLYSDRVKIERQQNPMCGLGFSSSLHGSPRPEYPTSSSKSATAHQPSSLLASSSVKQPKSEMMFSLYGYQPDLKYVSHVKTEQVNDRCGRLKEEKLSPSSKQASGSDSRKYQINHFSSTNGNSGLRMNDVKQKTEGSQKPHPESLKTKSVIVEPLVGSASVKDMSVSNLRDSYRHGGSITLGTAGQRSSDCDEVETRRMDVNGIRPFSPSPTFSHSSLPVGSARNVRPHRPLSQQSTAASSPSMSSSVTEAASSWPAVSEKEICGVGQAQTESLMLSVENRHTRPQSDRYGSSSVHRGLDRQGFSFGESAVNSQDPKSVGLQGQSVTINSLIQQGLVPNPLYTPAAIQAANNPSRISLPQSLTLSSPLQPSIGPVIDSQSSAEEYKESQGNFGGSKRRAKKDYTVVPSGRKKVKLEASEVHNSVTLGSVRKAESVTTSSSRPASTLLDGSIRLLVSGETPNSTANSTVGCGNGNGIRPLPGYNDSFKSFVDNTVQNAFFSEGKVKSVVLEEVESLLSSDDQKRTNENALRQIVGSPVSGLVAAEIDAGTTSVLSQCETSVGGSCHSNEDCVQSITTPHDDSVLTTNVSLDDMRSGQSSIRSSSTLPPIVQTSIPTPNLQPIVDSLAISTIATSQVPVFTTEVTSAHPVSCQTPPPQTLTSPISQPHSHTPPLFGQSSSHHYTKKAWLQRYSHEDKTKTTTASSCSPILKSESNTQCLASNKFSEKIKDTNISICDELSKMEGGCTLESRTGEDGGRSRKSARTPSKHQARIKNEIASTSESDDTKSMDSICSRKTRSRISRNVSIAAAAAAVKKRKHSSDDVEDSPPMPKLVQESNTQETRLNTDAQSVEEEPMSAEESETRSSSPQILVKVKQADNPKEMKSISDCEMKMACQLRKDRVRAKGSPSSVLENKPLNRQSDSKRRKTKEAFLQDGSCSDVTPKLVKCRECKMTRNQRNKSTPNIFCRFYAFRKLRYSAKGFLAIAGFSRPTDADADDIALWMPIRSGTELQVDQAKYILSNILSCFGTLLEHEQRSIEQNQQRIKIAWKRAIQGVREMCDACDATLFNIHWACQKCGFAVCTQCYNERMLQESTKTSCDKDSNVPTRDWLTCCANRQSHDLESLMVTQIIPSDGETEILI